MLRVKSYICLHVICFRYLEIVRRLQLRYQMEPAGSHGAWSLDDYQFVPFIWGSAQLIGSIIIYIYFFLLNINLC